MVSKECVIFVKAVILLIKDWTKVNNFCYFCTGDVLEMSSASSSKAHSLYHCECL